MAEKYEEHGNLGNVLISPAGARSTASGPVLDPLLAVLGRSWGLCWRSWAALGVYVGGPGPLLGLLWAVLGRLGAYVGGPGRLLVLSGGSGAEKWPKPEREQGSQRVKRPNPSEPDFSAYLFFL